MRGALLAGTAIPVEVVHHDWIDYAAASLAS